MSTFRRALFVSTIASGAAAAAWLLISRWRDQAVQLGGARAYVGVPSERSRDDEIEALTQQQKDLMLRELSGHV